MKSLAILFVLLTVCSVACTNVSSPTSTPESVEELGIIETPSPTIIPSPTSTPSPTVTPLPTLTATSSFTPSPSPTPTSTHTPTPTPHPLADLPYRILFSSNRENNNPDIFTMKTDGSDWQQLTDSPAFDFAPQISPDGQTIAFSSDRDGTFQIYLMDTDGNNVVRLTDNIGNDRDPSWSPDGSMLVFSSDRNGNPDIFLINVDGSGEQLLTDSDTFDFSPVWSPDGQWIVYSSSKEEEDPNLYLMRPDGSEKQRITFSPNYDGDQAFWSPDNEWLIFPSSRIGNYELYAMSLDGLSFYTLTRTERDEYSGLLSPDGQYLLMNVYSGELIGLVVQDLATGEEFQVTDSTYHASFAAWIPDETSVYNPEILPSAAMPDETCVYADDDTYGYTAENPIPNGNGPQFGGPFDGLFVYNIVRVRPGESQTSLRQHTFPSNSQGDYLDTYLLTSSGGSSVVLYANINDYEIPEIPIGMFCDLTLP